MTKNLTPAEIKIRNFKIVKNMATGYTIMTMAISFVHIVMLALMFDAHLAEAIIAPVLIDGFVIMGKLGDRPGITKSARLVARTISIVAGTISLAANVAVGALDHKPASAVIGAIAVIGFWVAEYLTHKLTPTGAAASGKVNKDNRTPDQIKRSAAARKAAATRRANAAAKAAS